LIQANPGNELFTTAFFGDVWSGNSGQLNMAE